MKRNLQVLLTFLFALIPVFTSAQTLESAIEKRQFTIDVDWAIPSSGKSINLSPSIYTLRVEGDSAYASLPFFGRSYSVSYDEVGISFDTKMEEYTFRKIDRKKRSRTEISFKVRTAKDQFDVSIAVYPNGECTVSVLTSRRAPISYRGHLYPIADTL